MSKPQLILVLLGAAAFGGCQRQTEAPVAATPPAAGTTAAATATPTPPAAAEAVPLAPDLASRLVRSYSPVIGPANAPVTIVEFLDPACEACRAFAPVVKQILFLHPEDVRVVVRYAAFHQGSDEAIRLLEAARRQGKFETLLTALFDGQDTWASHHSPNLQEAWKIATASGLDMARARKDAASSEAGELLRQENDDIVALKVERTPTFFVNGKPLVDFGAEPLMKLVADEVAAAKQPAN
jgi:protein-disulfide isomerase